MHRTRRCSIRALMCHEQPPAAGLDDVGPGCPRVAQIRRRQWQWHWRHRFACSPIAMAGAKCAPIGISTRIKLRITNREGEGSRIVHQNLWLRRSYSTKLERRWAAAPGCLASWQARTWALAHSTAPDPSSTESGDLAICAICASVPLVQDATAYGIGTVTTHATHAANMSGKTGGREAGGGCKNLRPPLDPGSEQGLVLPSIGSQN